MTLAEQMIKYRAVYNLTQKELAKRCNVTQQTICNIENGVQNPSALTAAKIRLVVDRIEVKEED